LADNSKIVSPCVFVMPQVAICYSHKSDNGQSREARLYRRRRHTPARPTTKCGAFRRSRRPGVRRPRRARSRRASSSPWPHMPRKSRQNECG